MSLDVDLMVFKPVSVFSQNITHNLGTMADAVELHNGKSLYAILWQPDENGYINASDILSLLHEGLIELTSFPEKYKKYNPENGWGSYDNLVEFVSSYYAACLQIPEAELEVSR
jgi:hypothetical protein